MSDRDKFFIDAMVHALRTNAHARHLYFPTDKQQRREGSLKLGRAIGFGLSVDADLGTLYSRLVVTFSFDRTGVCVDNKEFLGAVREGMAKAREA